MFPYLLPKKILPALLTFLVGLISSGALVAQTETWTVRSPKSSAALYGITYGSELFVVCGEKGNGDNSEGVIQTSPNGIDWTSRNSGTNRALRGICFGAGQFVAVGAHGAIVTSPDAITWTPRTSGTTLFLSGVAYGAGKFVAVGAGKIVSSTDGITWALVTSDTVNGSVFYQDVIFANGRFLAVGQRGSRNVLTSTDGSVWSKVNFASNGSVFAAAYFKGRYYTGGAFGEDVIGDLPFYGPCLSSADLITWREESTLTFRDYSAMSTDGNTLIALVFDGTILSTSDGKTWKSIRDSNSRTLFGASFGQGLCVAVGVLNGSSGTILTSPQNPLPDAFETWRSLEFTTAELAELAISGPQADADADGISNLAEFVHGLSPKSPDTNSERLPRFRTPNPAGESVDFEWTINKNSIGRVNVSIRYSETLASDSWQTLAVTPSILESSEQFDSMSASHASPPKPNCFYRFEYQLLE